MLRSDGSAPRGGWRLLAATVLLAALTGGAAAPSSAGSHEAAQGSPSDPAGAVTADALRTTPRRPVLPARPDRPQATTAAAEATVELCGRLDAGGLDGALAPGGRGHDLLAGVCAAYGGRAQPVMRSLPTSGEARSAPPQAPAAPDGTIDDPPAGGAVDEVAPAPAPCPRRGSWGVETPSGALQPAMGTAPQWYGDRHHDGYRGSADGMDGDGMDGDGRDHGDDGWEGRSEGGERL